MKKSSPLWMRILKWLKMKLFPPLILLIVMSGCRTNPRIIRVSIVPYPEEANGFLTIMTNEPIEVSVNGVEDSLTELDVGGYILIHPRDLRELIKRLKDD